jgi:hypothetical protein
VNFPPPSGRVDYAAIAARRAALASSRARRTSAHARPTTIPFTSADIIQQLNLRFRTDFTEADELLFDAVIADEVAKAGVRDKAHANSFENFRIAVEGALEGAMIDRMDCNAGIVSRFLNSKFLNEEDFKAQVVEWIAKQIYAKSRGEAA